MQPFNCKLEQRTADVKNNFNVNDTYKCIEVELSKNRAYVIDAKGKIDSIPFSDIIFVDFIWEKQPVIEHAKKELPKVEESIPTGMKKGPFGKLVPIDKDK